MMHNRAYSNLVETIGHTPIVRINRLIPESHATVLAKCEFFNPLSSVKDRIGIAMIVMKFGGTSVGDAERIRQVVEIVRGRLARRPVVVVSAQSGVTNILIELAGAAVAGVADASALRDHLASLIAELGLPEDLSDVPRRTRTGW